MRKNVFYFRLLLGSLVSFFMISGVCAQGSAEAKANQSTASIEDLPVRPMRIPALEEVEGSIFLSEEYKTGSVQLTDDKTVNGVPVKFNIYNNVIMVQKEGKDMRLDSFHLVSYDENGNDGSVVHFRFKAGYPEIDKHTENSIYQVLSLGPNAHLLKFLSQNIEDNKGLGSYSRKDIINTSQLYIYVPGAGIKAVKASKQSLLEALPGMAAKIDAITTAKKLKLKKGVK